MHTEHVKLGPDGRLVMPAELRKSVGLKPGDTLVIESDGDSLLVRQLDVVVREVQNVRPYYFVRLTCLGDTGLRHGSMLLLLARRQSLLL